jgi:outer membrane protein assembly factor BamB
VKQGSWSDISDDAESGATLLPRNGAVTLPVFDLFISHGGGSADLPAYSYTVLPGAGAEAMAQLSSDKGNLVISGPEARSAYHAAADPGHGLLLAVVWEATMVNLGGWQVLPSRAAMFVLHSWPNGSISASASVPDAGGEQLHLVVTAAPAHRVRGNAPAIKRSCTLNFQLPSGDALGKSVAASCVLNEVLQLPKALPWPMYGQSPSHCRERRAAPPIGTDAKRWQHQTGGWVYSAPAVGEDEAIYFSSWDGQLYAAHPDGSPRWKIKVGTSSGLEEQLWSSPALGGGGSDPVVYVGANESLVAVSQTGGVPTIIWSVRTKAAIFASPTIGGDGVIFIGSLDSTMRAVAPDGTTLWVHEAMAPIYASAAVSSDAVYFSTLLDGRVVKLGRHDGRLRWSKAASLSPIPSSPSLSPDGLTLYAASTDGNLRAIDTANGEVRWALAVGLVDGSSPAVASDGTIYIGTVESTDPGLFAIKADGKLQWKVRADSMVQSSPAVGAGGAIFFSSFKASLYMVGQNGTVEWTARLGGTSFSSPALGNRGVYLGINIGLRKGAVVAFLGDHVGR